MATAASQSVRLALASQSQGALGAIEQNLLIADYEPKDIRPPRDWIDTRRDAMRRVEQLIGPLFLEANIDASSSANNARRLTQQAEAVAPAASPADHPAEDVVQSETHGDTAVALDLRAITDMRLRNLQKSLNQGPLQQQAVSYASA